MSAHYALEVLRAQDVTWQPQSRFHSKARNFYVKIKFGNEEKKTHMQDKIPLTWSETLTLSSNFPWVDRQIIVELNYRSSLRRKTCVGSTVTSLQSLLNESASGEVQLNLFPPGQAGPSTGTGILFVRLKRVSAMEATNTDIRAAVADVERSGIVNGGMAARVGAVNQVAAGLNSQNDLARSLANILKKMDGFVHFIDRLSTVHPYLSAAWQVVSSLYRVIRNQVETDRRLVGLAHRMEEIFDVISDAEFIRNKIKSLERPIKEFLQQTNECCLFIQQYIRRHSVERILSTSRQKIDEFSTKFQDLKEALHTGISIQTAFVSVRLSEQSFDKSSTHPRWMQPAGSNVFPELGRKYLRRSWTGSSRQTEENVLWLRGVAGCGKSTISMTIAEYCLYMRRRGAYLFFERGKNDPSSVIRTIAFWLASFDQSIATRVIEAVRGHNGITKASITMQFDKLLSEPLKSSGCIQGPVIIILDALDECGTLNTRDTLLSLLGKEFPKLPHTFRFLVTSCPEPDVCRALSSSSVRMIELQSSRNDVSLYISHEMHTIFEGMELSSDWKKKMALLSNMANGLFVWASTIVKLISTSPFPLEELEDLISYCKSDDRASQWNRESDLDDLYDNVLRRSGLPGTMHGLNRGFNMSLVSFFSAKFHFNHRNRRHPRTYKEFLIKSHRRASS